MRPGDRVKTKHKFLGDGEITRVIPGVGYLVRLDEKSPNDYAYETKDILLFPEDLEVE